MPTNATPEDQLVERVRQLESRHTLPVTEELWARVAEGLPASDARARPLRVAYSSTRRMRRLAAVAAVLLAVLGLTWYLAGREASRGSLVTQASLQRSLDRRALEGPLELDGRTRPLGRDLYRGVAVKEGTLATDVLRACDPC